MFHRVVISIACVGGILTDTARVYAGCGDPPPPPVLPYDLRDGGGSLSAAAFYAADQVDPERIRRWMVDDFFTYLGANRYGGAMENALLRGRIAAIFQSFGLPVTFHEFTLFGLHGISVIAEKVGTVRPADIYVVTGHFDSFHNPGADDNASGAAAVLEMARLVSQWPSDATIRFISLDREEDGKVGAKAYVPEHLSDNFRGVISIDMTAFRYGPHRSVPIYGRTTSLELKNAIAAALTQVGGMSVWVGPEWNGSDHAPFEAAGFQGALLLEWDYVRNPHYHQPGDSTQTPGYIDYDNAAANTRGVLAWLIDAAGVHPPNETGDCNCDFRVNDDDLPAITLAVTDLPAYSSQYPDCDPMLADCDHDGVLTVADIAAFLDLLSANCRGPAVVADVYPAGGGHAERAGSAVAFDGERALLGAPWRPGSEPDSGAAYVCERDPNSGVWSVAALLEPPPGAGGQFGAAVAIGDEVAVIGAPFCDSAGVSAGAAYVFARVDGHWAPVAQLVGADTAARDSFGSALSLSAATLVVGAPGNDALGDDCGAAYVFDLVDGAWTQTAVLRAPDAAAGANFGASLALSGESLAVGAPHADSLAARSGAVYVYDRVDGTWTWTAKLLAPDMAAEEHFGTVVALDGDVLAAGKSFTTSWGSPGSTYVFTRVGGMWSVGHKLTDWSHAGGVAVAVSDERVIVGRSNGDLPRLSGAAYVFERVEGMWRGPVVVRPPGVAQYDGFGVPLAANGDVVLAGAPGRDTGWTNAGGGFLIDVNAAGTPWISSQPSGGVVQVGGSAGFSVLAGPADVQYRWRKDGELLVEDDRIHGVATANLVVTSVTSLDAGVYSVDVKNACGLVASAGAVLQILVAGRGDLNCDGSLDFDDINPFVLALSDPVLYQATYPDCDILAGDCNGDGDVDFKDINAFVGLLASWE